MKILIISLFSISCFLASDSYPVPPKTDSLLFYIQRNRNSNTVIYDAQFNDDGTINATKPMDIYWLQYDEDGKRKELSSIERTFAYGIKHKQLDTTGTFFQIELASKKDHAFWLKQVAPHKAKMFTRINGEMAQLDYIYFFADFSGWWPSVEYVELYGTNYPEEPEEYERVIIE